MNDRPTSLVNLLTYIPSRQRFGVNMGLNDEDLFLMENFTFL